jgi:hypothetical protein
MQFPGDKSFYVQAETSPLGREILKTHHGHFTPEYPIPSRWCR